MAPYRKAIVALAGLVLIILNEFLNFGIDPDVYNEQVESMVNAGIGLLMTIGVYQIANKPGGAK